MQVNSARREDNCQKELRFGVHTLTSNQIVPVVLDPPMAAPAAWSGRLAMVLGGLLFVNLGGEVDDARALGQLETEIRRRLPQQ